MKTRAMKWQVSLMLKTACAALILSFLSTLSATAQSRKPNIIFILSDDLGWGDLSVYGHDRLKTPNLDRLARQGMLFTSFYVNGPVCSPSRAAFFAGQYPGRNRVHGHFATPQENTRRNMPHWLDPQLPNIASVLKSVGYKTAHIGKWHLSPASGGPTAIADPAQPRMKDYGFDFIGTDEGKFAGAVNPADPYFRARSSALFVDEALQFIRETDKEQPFFINLWMLVPHATLNPTEEQMKPFTRFTTPNIPHRSTETVYYASVADLDAQVGRLLTELDKQGLAENTIIVFSSDNGPEDIHITNSSHSGIGSAGPFRGRKRSLYEGGVRVPFIVRWPGRIPAGKVNNDAVMAGVDLLPTLAHFAGATIPKTHALDGEDLSEVWQGRGRARSKPLLWEWRYQIFGERHHRSPMLAIRDGRWKLLLNPDGSRTELYDIPADPGETDNLAAQHPDIVARLSKLALAWQATLPAGPMDGGAGKNNYPWPKETQK